MSFDVIIKHKEKEMLLNDPIEQTSDYKKIEKELQILIEKEVGKARYPGYCHRYWAAKKRILREKYNINWKSPAELNQGVFFD